MPPQTVQRYLVEKKVSPYALWRFAYQRNTMPYGKKLRIETFVPAVIHWSVDDWKTSGDIKSNDTGLGIYVVDLPVEEVPTGNEIVFTFYWPQADRWEGNDFSVRVVA